MWTAFFLFVISGAIFLGTEKCRRDPEHCKDIFMTERGWTRSPFAIKYLGKPQEARAAIVNDAELRRKHILYSYGLSLFFFVLSIVAYVSNIG